MGGLTLRYAARSDIGIVRTSNEDSGYAGPALLVVADGMGGHAAGELASATAVATLAEVSGSDLDADPVADLADAVALITERLGEVVAEQPGYAGMGTTLTAIAWLGDRVAVVHVGDSRAYLLREGSLDRITHDHTFVQTLVDAGRITAAEAAVHPRRSLLTRAIDGNQAVEPDISVREVHPGDRFLLCSDGLTGVISDPQLAALLAEGDPTGVVGALVELALERGAPDNVTVVIADVVEAPDSAPAEDAAALEQPVVVGAAGEQRNRDRLPDLEFPADAQPDPDREVAIPSAGAGAGAVPIAGADLGELGRVYAEERAARRRRPRIGRWLAALAVLAVLAGLVAGSLAWVRSQWFVGESDGFVAVYNGIPGNLGPVGLHSVDELTDIQVERVSTYNQGNIRDGIRVADRAATPQVVEQLRSSATYCSSLPTPTGCPDAAPGPSPTASAPTSPAPAFPTPPSPSRTLPSASTPGGAPVLPGASPNGTLVPSAGP